MSAVQLAKDWIEKHTKEGAKLKAETMVEYRVQPLEYWDEVLATVMEAK